MLGHVGRLLTKLSEEIGDGEAEWFGFMMGGERLPAGGTC